MWCRWQHNSVCKTCEKGKCLYILFNYLLPAYLNIILVIAIDIDPKKIEMARHNATIYGVQDKIEFIVGDYFDLVEGLKADVVFLSPPWGGPDYMRNEIYDLELSLQPAPASKLMEATRKITTSIAVYLPRNSNSKQLALLAGPGNAVEIEQNFLDRKLIALTAYYGDLVQK